MSATDAVMPNSWVQVDDASSGLSTFGRSSEQVTLRKVLEEVLARYSSMSVVRSVMMSELGYDQELWAVLSNELGLTSLGFGEESGESGLGFVDVTLVQETLGNALACVPYFPSVVLAGSALREACGPEAEEYLGEIAAGKIACLAGLEPSQDGPLHAEQRDGRWVLRGTAPAVIGGDRADLVITFAATADGSALFAAQAGSDLTSIPIPTFDLTRRAADLIFQGTIAQLVAGPDKAEQIRARVRRRGAVALAAEMLGGALRCLDMSVEYAKIRKQFGRPIGSFQAIKHMCADMVTRTNFVDPAVYYAAWALDADCEDAELMCSVAKYKAGDAFLNNARACVQVHGGIGYTWEHDAHLFLKRAISSRAQLGTPEQHRSVILKGLKPTLRASPAADSSA